MLAEIHHGEGPASAPALERLRISLRSVLVEIFGLSSEGVLPKPTLVHEEGRGVSVRVTAVQLSVGEVNDPAAVIQSALRAEAPRANLKVQVVCAEGVFTAA